MTIGQIEAMLRNKLITLESLKDAAFASGDIDSYTGYETQIAETTATLNKLTTLPA